MFVQGISAMIRLSTIAAAFCLASLLFSQPGYTQVKPEIERLYILNCGEGVAGDISRWSPGVNVGKSMDFADSCYLIKHAHGWLLWDTGVTDAIRSHAGWSETIGSWRDPLEAAKDACLPTRSARGQARGYQIRCGVSHPP